MDKFVKGENEMWKMPAKERIQTSIVAASAVKRLLDFRHQLSVCPATHLKMFRQKEATTQQSSLITEMWQNIFGENLRLLNSKMLSIFGSHRLHLWTHTFCSVASHVTLPCVSYRPQLTIATSLCFYSFRAEFHKIGQLPTVLLMVSRIIYLFISINVIV